MEILPAAMPNSCWAHSGCMPFSSFAQCLQQYSRCCSRPSLMRCRLLTSFFELCDDTLPFERTVREAKRSLMLPISRRDVIHAHQAGRQALPKAYSSVIRAEDIFLYARIAVTSYLQLFTRLSLRAYSICSRHFTIRAFIDYIYTISLT